MFDASVHVKWWRRLSSSTLLALLLSVAGGVEAQSIVYYIHTDALGSPVAVTDAAGTVVERTDYEPYGSLVGKIPADGPGFGGHVADAQTGLSYMQQRYFDPQIGRFLSVDPVSAASGPMAVFNRYSYAANSPYRFIDPDGRQYREFNAENRRLGIEPPPRAEGDWLGPAIGGALAVLSTPAVIYGGIEVGLIALANPATSNSIGLAAAELFMGDALGGNPLSPASVIGKAGAGADAARTYGPFHRLGDSAGAVQEIRASGELRGNPPTNFFRSDIPKVKAYDGPLPAGAKGFEFTTPVAPDRGHVPGKPTWSPGTPGVQERGGQAIIQCTVTQSNGC
ncbi:RHS repeat domain-containing protein [Stenotrophomonas maltophilia]|uniref:RHS repeat domain-containing protein n=1 Tax=Stenotrophomonas maltophilia TaxID=40324 RepID=UPI001C660B39|nr:RHS repeat-associated core domain-containing protein [Stenotrophomonas maltophilia]